MTMRALRAVYNFTLDRDEELPSNPVRLKKVWFKIKNRETIVEDTYKPKFYEAVCAPEPLSARLNPVFHGRKARGGCSN